MEKVTTINLGGNAFQLEETGFARLSAYLAEARAKLTGNPDIDEIISDLEMALAQKCRTALSTHKTVVTNAEVDKIIEDMGPVEGDSDAKEEKPNSASVPKRLYRIKEGAMIAGVCTGLAAYLNIEVTIIRIVFLILAILTSGVWILAYIAMVFIIPSADTPEEHAKAFGAVPITAQHLVDRAREGYDSFRNSKEWQDWKLQMKEQSRQWKHDHEAWKQSYEYGGYTYSPFWSFMHSLLGLVWTLLIFCGLWFLYHNSIIAKELMDTVGMALYDATVALIEKFRN